MISATPRFAFVGFGSRAPSDAVCCDGLVPGAGLDLSHWRGNATPRELKADTSVEIALRLAQSGGAARLVVNNHFDTDGVLAVWALLEPERAMVHRELIVAAAETGDFEEWPGEPRGLWLDAAITALATGVDDESNYARVLPRLGALVEGIDTRRDLWGEADQALARADERASQRLHVSVCGAIALFHHRGIDELPGAVLSRRAPAGVARWLIAIEAEDGMFRYRYERPRWAWADTVRRPVIVEPDRQAIAAALGADWSAQASGMTAVAASGLVSESPVAVVERILAADDLAR